jgi:hypothetical protein
VHDDDAVLGDVRREVIQHAVLVAVHGKLGVSRHACAETQVRDAMRDGDAANTSDEARTYPPQPPRQS